jgi:hypothetical protein
VAFKKELQSVNCRHLDPCLLQDLTGSLSKKIQAKQKQTSFVFECAVKAAAADFHGIDQVAHGGGLIAFAPEEQQGLVNGLLVIEFNGTGHAHIME